MTNLTYNSFLCIYFNSLHVSSNPVLIIRRINFINIISGICQSVSVTFSCAGRKGIFRPAHETVTDTEWHIPEVVLIQLILLMMSTGLLETCRELNKYIEKNCESRWPFTKNHADSCSVNKESEIFVIYNEVVLGKFREGMSNGDLATSSDVLWPTQIIHGH